MAEGNIEVTVVWAPADGVRMLLERAASMLTGYGELIRRDGASHVEEHHYLPEVEHVAAELRALMDATPRTCGQLGMTDGDNDVGQTFGIIDPDYARVFTQARIIAWNYGYACLAHGSFTRDLDLLLVPWTNAAQADDVDRFAPRIAKAAGLKLNGYPPSVRPHGRKTWTLLFPEFADPRWVDLSVLTPNVGVHPQAPALQDKAALCRNDDMDDISALRDDNYDPRC